MTTSTARYASLTRRAVLITVPYKENLLESSTR